MIKITIELWPFGLESNKRKIGEMVIYNDGTGTKEIGAYNAWWKRVPGRKKHESRVVGFPRLRDNVFDLMRAALNNEKLFKEKKDEQDVDL